MSTRSYAVGTMLLHARLVQARQGRPLRGVVSPSIDLGWAKSARQAALCSLGISKVDECACMLVAARPKRRVESALRHTLREFRRHVFRV